MVQNAIVKKQVSSGVVEVSLLRQMECGLHCDGACAGCGQKPPEEILALATDTIGTKPGEFVVVEPATAGNLSLPVIVFVLPCIGLVLGYLLAAYVLHLGEGVSLIGAALGAVLGFLPAWLLNRSIVKRNAPEFSILRRLR